MGLADCTTRSATARKPRNGQPAFQFSATDVAPLTEMMPMATPALSAVPASTMDAFIGYSSVTIEHLEENLELLVQATQCGAISLRKSIKAIESVESQIHNVGELCNSGRSSHVIDGFEITDELNAGFTSEMVAWKAAIKHLGKRAGIDSKELHTILEGTFLALSDEFSWGINGNECGIMASDWGLDDGDDDDGMHLSFERDRPALFFEAEVWPVEVADLLLSGYQGICGDTLAMLDMSSECFDDGGCVPLESAALYELLKQPFVKEWLLSDDLNQLANDDSMSAEEKGAQFDSLAERLQNKSEGMDKFCLMVKARITDNDFGAGVSILEALLSLYTVTLNSKDCLDALLNADCPKLRFYGLVAQFIESRDTKPDTEHLVFNPTYAHPASNIYLSVIHPSFIGTVMESAAYDFSNETQYSADNSCGNCGDGERGIGFIIDLSAQFTMTKVNREAMLSTKEVLFMLLTSHLWG